MKYVEDEFATVLWLLLVSLLIAWVTQAWLFVGWLVAFILASRWLIALWVAEGWLRSGGRTLNKFFAGPLSYFLRSTFRLLEKERRQARQLLGRARYFKQAAEALPEGVVALDGSHRIEWFNRGAIALLGLRRRNRGQIISSVLRLPDVLALVNGHHEGALEITSPVDVSRTLNIELTPFLQGHHLLIIRDITDFKRHDAIRRDFVANASHELRTPLTVMQGYVEMMLDTPSSHADYWHKPLEQMYNQTERMRKIVEDMLTLSSLEANDIKLKQEEVNVPLLLEQIVDEAHQLSGKRAHHISLSLDTDMGIRGHEEYLRSAFTNLISNAVRYTPDGGHIWIRWWQDAAGGHLSVKDTGIGMNAEHLPRITERFYRVDSARSRETGGTGLGLAITRHVLERHQATLSVESTMGEGSCFSCHFPPTSLIVI